MSEAMTMKNEGFREKPYRDTKGKLTIGFGFNLEDPSMIKELDASRFTGDRKLSLEDAKRVFRKRLGVAHDDARKFIGGKAFDSLSENQQNALVDMSYNMGGPKLSRFVKMKEAILAGKFGKAAKEILNSDYAKQVKGRADRNASLMRGDADEVEQEVERQLT